MAARSSQNALGPSGGIPTLVGGFALLALIAMASVFLYFSNHGYIDAVERSQEIQSGADRVLLLLQDAETGQRGFLLTRDRNYLRPYISGTAEASAAISSLRAMVVSSNAETAIVDRLDTFVKRKLLELGQTIARADAGDFEGALAIVKNDSGNTFMADIRQVVRMMTEHEADIRTKQAASANLTNTIFVVLAVVGVVVVALLAFFAIRTSVHTTKRLVAARLVLQDTNSNLERIVEERVGDLKLANEEVQRFAYIVSHDLRAPLVNVLGFTSELDAIGSDLAKFMSEVQEKAPNLLPAETLASVKTDLPEALGFIRSSTAKMDRLINAILKLSREGRRKLAPEHLDIVRLVQVQADSLSQQLSARNATIKVAGALPSLDSDRLAVEQIFGNLIENAVKYLTQDRPGEIVVTGESESLFNSYTIADNGRGISQKDYERIFDLFRRSGEQDTPGEGIGLAYVRNLVRRLGGSISVQSELGKGSSFTVKLPITFVAFVGAEL